MSDWLDAENYPNIELYIDDVVNVKVVKGSKNFKTYSMTLVGTFSLDNGLVRFDAAPGVRVLNEGQEVTYAIMDPDDV